MIRWVLSTMVRRPAPLIGAFIALWAGATIVLAFASLLQTGIANDLAPGRTAGADVVVAGNATVQLPDGTKKDTPKFETGYLADRVAVPASTMARIQQVAGVRTVSGVGGDAATGFDLLRVATEPGARDVVVAQRIRAAMPELFADRLLALTGDRRGLADAPGAAAGGPALVVVAAVSGGVSVAVVTLVGFSTLAAAGAQRRRQHAMLRIVGAGARQLRRAGVLEATIIAIPAAALAIWPGRALGEWLLHRIAGGGLVPAAVLYRSGWIPLLATVGVVVGCAVLAGWGATRRISKLPPAAGMTDAATDRWLHPARLMAAAVCFAGGIALLVVTATVFDGPVAASTAGPACLLWAAGFALIGPGISKVLTIPIGAVLQLCGPAARLAVATARSQSRRTATVVVPLTLAIGIGTGMIYLQLTSSRAEQDAFARTISADATLTAPASSAALSTIHALPVVSAASETRVSNAFVIAPSLQGQDDQGSALIAVDEADRLLGVPATSGSLADLRGETVALPVDLARAGSLTLGDLVTLRLGDGSDRQLRIVALTGSPPGARNGPAPIVVPAAVLPATGDSVQILVRAAPGVGADALDAALRAALPADGPTTSVAIGDRNQLLRSHSEKSDPGLTVNLIIVAVIVGFLVIAVATSTALRTTERRRDIAVTRCVGASRGFVLRSLVAETLIAAIAGTLLGTFVAACALIPFDHLVSGQPWPAGSPLIFLGLVVGTTIAALLTTVIPAWATTRGKPVRALEPG